MRNSNISIIPRGEDLILDRKLRSFVLIFCCILLFGLHILVDGVLSFSSKNTPLVIIIVLTACLSIASFVMAIRLEKSNCVGLVLTSESIKILNQPKIMWKEVEYVKIGFDQRRPALQLKLKKRGTGIYSWFRERTHGNIVLISLDYVEGYSLENLYTLVNYSFQESKKVITGDCG